MKKNSRKKDMKISELKKIIEEEIAAVLMEQDPKSPRLSDLMVGKGAKKTGKAVKPDQLSRRKDRPAIVDEDEEKATTASPASRIGPKRKRRPLLQRQKELLKKLAARKSTAKKAPTIKQVQRAPGILPPGAGSTSPEEFEKEVFATQGGEEQFKGFDIKGTDKPELPKKPGPDASEEDKKEYKEKLQIYRRWYTKNVAPKLAKRRAAKKKSGSAAKKGSAGSRREARLAARKAGELTYTWKGKKYGTRGGEEDVAAFKRKMAKRRAAATKGGSKTPAAAASPAAASPAAAAIRASPEAIAKLEDLASKVNMPGKMDDNFIAKTILDIVKSLKA